MKVFYSCLSSCGCGQWTPLLSSKYSLSHGANLWARYLRNTGTYSIFTYSVLHWTPGNVWLLSTRDVLKAIPTSSLLPCLLPYIAAIRNGCLMGLTECILQVKAKDLKIVIINMLLRISLSWRLAHGCRGRRIWVGCKHWCYHTCILRIHRLSLKIIAIGVDRLKKIHKRFG